MKTARIEEVMRLIAADAEADALKVDSTPFTPRGVGENFGNIYAAIKALAEAVELLARAAGAPTE